MVKSKLPLVAVVAVAENGVIGANNQLLWRIKSDLKRFRGLTMGKPLIMGRKTFLSIGKPLPGRETIILTRDRTFKAEGAAVAFTMPDAVAMAESAATRLGAKEIIIAGGGDIYGLFLPFCSIAHVTLVRTHPVGDAHFPWPMPAGWREVHAENHPSSPDDEFATRFMTYNHAI